MINLQIIPIFGLDNIQTFKKGGRIHIKKKNRGKFTKSAKAARESVQEHAAKVLSDPNATPLQRKRANFARNAAKWKYQSGGTLSQKDKDSQNKSESIESKVSTAIMNLAWIGKLKANRPSDTDLTRDGGVAQRTYLLNREDQKKEFLNAGYIEGKEGDYGLVRKAVGNRDIPIYQREPDATKREDLVPIGNINNRYFPDKGELFHARNFPTALYYNYQNGKFYQKAWDLNDYGGSTGHTTLQKFGANVLDMIGSPTVVTSGFQEISNDTLREYYKTLSPFIKKFFKSKGLIYDYLESTDVNPTIYLPEIIITGKSRNKLSNSNSDQIYIEGMGLVNKAKRTFQKEGKISAQYKTQNIYAKKDQNNTMQKHQQGGIIDRSPLNFVKNDNTRVFRPIIIEKISYKLKPNELYFVDKKTGKKTLIKQKQETVSADNRTTNQRKQDQTTAKQIQKKQEADKNYEKGLETISTLSTLAMPSTYIGPVFNNNGKSYLDNVISGEGTGNTAGNLAIDLVMPFNLKLNKFISTKYKIPKNLEITNNLSNHLQGEEAVKMFKQYGGMKIPEGSINGEQLRKYVQEARIRYGLINNKNITDKEIAQSLYKHVLELGKGSAAKNIQGEPQLLFRGDTKRYTELKPRPTPEELEKMGGTMDNSLGNLFLGQMPESMGGLERYIVHIRDFGGDKRIIGSGTGSKAVLPDGNAVKEFTNDVIGTIPEGSYQLYSYPYKYGNISAYKLPASWSESGVNDINAFVVRTPNMRNASKEISVLNDDFIIQGGSKVDYYGPIRRKVFDKDGFPQIIDETGKVVGDGLAGSSDRSAMAKHYRQVLDKAKNEQQGLLKSNKNSLLRDEHDNYDYFALPNFNIRGAKHILPYDLRIPRDWNSSNIYKAFIPIGIATYGFKNN